MFQSTLFCQRPCFQEAQLCIHLACRHVPFRLNPSTDFAILSRHLLKNKPKSPIGISHFTVLKKNQQIKQNKKLPIAVNMSYLLLFLLLWNVSKCQYISRLSVSYIHWLFMWDFSCAFTHCSAMDSWYFVATDFMDETCKH